LRGTLELGQTEGLGAPVGVIDRDRRAPADGVRIADVPVVRAVAVATQGAANSVSSPLRRRGCLLKAVVADPHAVVAGGYEFGFAFGVVSVEFVPLVVVKDIGGGGISHGETRASNSKSNRCSIAGFRSAHHRRYVVPPDVGPVRVVAPGVVPRVHGKGNAGVCRRVVIVPSVAFLAVVVVLSFCNRHTLSATGSASSVADIRVTSVAR